MGMRISRELDRKIRQQMGEDAPGDSVKHKYHAKKTTVDGITFASKKEAKRYTELKLLQEHGKISDLKLQPSFDLKAEGGILVCRYVADFYYVEDGNPVVEDVKGFKTREYKLKRRFLKAQYGIEIRET